jgi:hypothetical protein
MTRLWSTNSVMSRHIYRQHATASRGGIISWRCPAKQAKQCMLMATVSLHHVFQSASLDGKVISNPIKLETSHPQVLYSIALVMMMLQSLKAVRTAPHARNSCKHADIKPRSTQDINKTFKSLYTPQQAIRYSRIRCCSRHGSHARCCLQWPIYFAQHPLLPGRSARRFPPRPQGKSPRRQLAWQHLL